jgi:predicted kinase
VSRAPASKRAAGPPPDAVILIGIQASGKTTFYQQRLADTHVRISRDVVRTRRRERLLVEACLAGGTRYVIDNTNPTSADRAGYIVAAREAGFRVVGYFFEPDPKGAFARNAQREGARRIPAAGLFGTLKRLERPTLAEGFDALFRVTIPAPREFAIEPWEGDSTERDPPP